MKTRQPVYLLRRFTINKLFYKRIWVHPTSEAMYFGWTQHLLPNFVNPTSVTRTFLPFTNQLNHIYCWQTHLNFIFYITHQTITIPFNIMYDTTTFRRKLCTVLSDHAILPPKRFSTGLHSRHPWPRPKWTLHPQ